MADLVIVSKHDKRFWQADLYLGAGSEYDPAEFESEGRAPDGFATFSIGGSLEDALTRSQEKWPDAVRPNRQGAIRVRR